MADTNHGKQNSSRSQSLSDPAECDAISDSPKPVVEYSGDSSTDDRTIDSILTDYLAPLNIVDQAISENGTLISASAPSAESQLLTNQSAKPKGKQGTSTTRPQSKSKSIKIIRSRSKSPLPPITIPPSLSIIIDPSTIMPGSARPASLLVASLGNPPPYHSTRHSAAHLVIQSLQQSLNLPQFSRSSRTYGGDHVSIGADVGRPELTLYQSASMMNVSGPPLLKAWKTFTATQDVVGRVPALVVLHDEMEIESAKLKLRRGNGSAKGHNGIKSVQSSLSGAGLLDGLGNRFVKIGVGIGRPGGGSRSSGDVSAYVLGQLTSKEKDDLEGCVSELAVLLYKEIERAASA